jgi:dTDP-4-amino-4,6-dideoxygalactose transaminase
VYLLDDAAQSMGAIVAGRAVGTFGDVGIYSLDKGKNITSIQGGIIAANSDRLAASLSARFVELPPASWKYTASLTLQLLIYAAFLHPSRYWIPGRLPGLGLGATRYEIDYPVTRYPAALGVMAERLFRRLDEIQAQRINVADAYREHLGSNPHIRLLQPVADAQPVYTRFPLLLDTTERRTRALQRLTEAGLGASRSYPNAVADVPEIGASLDAAGSHADVGREIAGRILTLPTHHYVTPLHIERICSMLNRV